MRRPPCAFGGNRVEWLGMYKYTACREERTAMAEKQRTVNSITEGVIWKQLLRFFFPLLLGTFFQQLYNTVDTVVVGRFVGKTALAAVGVTGVIANLTIGLFTGLASGAVVIIAQYYGARDNEKVSKSVHTAMMMAIICGAIFMVAGILLTPWALRTINTPDNAVEEATLYLRIFFLGMIPNAIYNMGTGVLRAIGDSRRPLYFLIVASLCNIVLDLVLVVGFGMGVDGAAIATVASQVLSAVLVVLSLSKSEGASYQLFFKELRIYGFLLADIIKIGLPAALQSLMYSSSNIVIQAVINGFGTDAVAAWTAYSKAEMIMWMSTNALGLALTTFVGQNYGAGEFGRVKKSVRIASGMGAGITVGLSLIMLFFARPLLGIFTPDAEVLEIGVEIMRFLAPTFITYVMVELVPGAVRGAGKSLVPMLISVFGICVLRLAWLLLVVPQHHAITMVCASYPITWTITSVALLIYYRFGGWLKPRKETRPAPGGEA